MADEIDINYVPPFCLLERALGISKGEFQKLQNISVSTELFKYIMGVILSRSYFDERWYLETYPDVQEAINAGAVASPQEHYINSGYYEGRRPGPWSVDRSWYERYYPDISEALEQRVIVDSAEHFQNAGYFEGRVPNADQLRIAERWLKALKT